MDSEIVRLGHWAGAALAVLDKRAMAPVTLITKERSTLSARGVYRAPWKDEGQRADMENEFAAQERTQRRSLSQDNHGISM